VSLLVAGIEAGIVGERGVVGSDIGRMTREMTLPGVVRRDDAGVVPDPPRRTDPVVLPGADLMRRTNPTVPPDTIPIPTRRKDHTVLLDVTPTPTKRTDRTAPLDIPNAPVDLVLRAAVHIPLVVPLPPNHPPPSHPRWTSILKNRMTLVWTSSHSLSLQYPLPVSSAMPNLRDGIPCLN